MAADDKKYQEMKEQIAMYLKKKDYYDVLGVPKNCNQAEIKKAYKKLALRFHPDKNNVEGSKEVFKKVSNAYTTLIDPEKKASYDRHGPEEDREPQYRPQRAYRQGYTQQDEFEQIFRAFFGGGAMPRQQRYQNNHFQHFTFNMGGPRAGANNQGNGSSSMIFFLVLIFVVYILPVFFSKQQPLFSTTATSTYKFPLKTSVFQAPYFVRQQYFTENKSGKYTRAIEEAVDTEYYIRLKKECDVEQWTVRNRATVSAAARKNNRESCLKMYSLQEKYQDYIRDLFYSY